MCAQNRVEFVIHKHTCFAPERKEPSWQSLRKKNELDHLAPVLLIRVSDARKLPSSASICEPNAPRKLVG